MKIRDNTVLITGGATGIGLALAETFIEAGNEVIVCGRRENRLKEAQQKLPPLHVQTCDISKEPNRKALFNWVKDNFPGINILVNNAGVQKMMDFKKGTRDLFGGENEIETNLAAPISLSAHFIPLFLKREEAAIISVSSGLGFVPIAAMPVYCATKAALHSFCISLRYQLKDTSIKVFEIIPPMVNTELDGGTVEEEEERGMSPEELARDAIRALEKDEYEIPIGEAQSLVNAGKREWENIFLNMNQW
jgi:uncharacterized oxidoreductase